MQLNAFIAKSGLCARRKAALLIQGGRVTVNGKKVLEPWYRIQERDSVKVDGKLLDTREGIYIIVNKPKGVTVTREDRFAARKITDIIPHEYRHLYPVGRLDRDSRGLLILTNDGDLCYRLTHPKFEIEKEYRVCVKGTLEDQQLKKLKKGVRDGADTLKVKTCSIVRSGQGRTELAVIVTEGKKRHLRRLFAAIGLTVLDLKRIRIGSLELGTLREGSFKAIKKRAIYKMALSVTV